MKKKLIRILAGLLVVLVALVLTMNLWLGPTIRKAVTTAGPATLKVPVDLADCSVRLLQGKVGLEGLMVGSPEGFKSPSMFELGEVRVEMDTGSFFSDEIHIRRIYIKDPKIVYEQGLTGNNIGALLDNLGSSEKKEGEAKPDEKKPAASASKKKVVIDEFLMEGATVKVAVKAIGGAGLPIPLPPVKLNDLGKDSGGIAPVEAVTAILVAVSKSVIMVVGDVGKLAGDAVEGGAKLIGESAGTVKDAGAAVGEGAGKVLKGIGGLFGGEKEKK